MSEKVRYSVDYNGDRNVSYDDSFSFEYRYNVDWDGDEWELSSLATECAEDYFHNCDGWDHRSWANGDSPLTFAIWQDEKTIIWREVWIEHQPSFVAVKPKSEPR